MTPDPPWSSLITRDAILELHTAAIQRFGHSTLHVGSNSHECVEAKLGNAWNAEAYRDSGDNDLPGLAFAGYLLYYLVRGHCFPDGNKRVGWAAAMAVLAELGLTVEASDDDAYDFVTRIASGGVSHASEAVYWLASRLEAPDL